MSILFEALWFLLPPGAANLIPPVAAKIWPNWDTPIDGGCKLFGKPLFGNSKTIRGLLSGIFLSSLTFGIQCLLSSHFSFIQQLKLDNLNCSQWWLGPYLGLAALFGDLIKSFIKRRLNFLPGESWPPWDQIDWVIGVLFATFLIFDLNFKFDIILILAGWMLSSVAKILGFWLKINSNWI